jgi:hypothetical protein
MAEDNVGLVYRAFDAVTRRDIALEAAGLDE